MNMERPVAAGGDGVEIDPRPIVALPSGGMSGAAIAVGCVMAAGLLFLVLNQQRIARDHPPTIHQPEAEIASPPPLDVPLGPVAPAPYALPGPVVVAPSPVAVPLQSATAAQSRPLTWRQSHPVVFEQWPPAQSAPASPLSPPPTAWPQPEQTLLPAAPSASAGPAIVQDNGESRQWSGAPVSLPSSGRAEIPPSRAGDGKGKASPRPIGDLAQTVAAGTMIEAVLETPVDSSRPGMTRAIVSRAVRSFDGSRILIPRGSRLVGDMGGAAQSGNRLLIKWNQVILPDGIALDINSPGADAQGQAGLDAKSHGGVGRFIGGILESAVNVGAAVIGSRSGPVYYAVPLAGTATQIVPKSSGGKRLTVASGAQINVVVAKTLDFSAA